MTSPAHFNRLSISVRDFEQAAEYAERAVITKPDTIEHQALLFAAIVIYYRPFSPNERKPSAASASSLKIEEFKALTSKELELHETCKTLRNKALAHAEYEMNPTKLEDSSGVISSRPFDLLSRAPAAHEIARLARKLAEQCHHKRADHIHHPSGGETAA